MPLGSEWLEGLWISMIFYKDGIIIYESRLFSDTVGINGCRSITLGRQPVHITSTEIYEECQMMDNTFTIRGNTNMEIEIAASLINMESAPGSSANMMIIHSSGHNESIQITGSHKTWERTIQNSEIHLKVGDSNAILLIHLKGMIT